MTSTNKKNIKTTTNKNKSPFPTKQELIEFYKKNNRSEEHHWKMCELPISLNKNLTIIQLKKNLRYKYTIYISYNEYMDCIYDKEKQLTLEYLRNEIADNKDFGIVKPFQSKQNRSSTNRV
jgi:hypothetical protein